MREAAAERRSGARLASLVREPVVHFLVIGGLLFGVFELMSASEDTGATSRIVVDRRALLTFMQYRTNAFESDLFNTQLNLLADDERRKVIDAYLREEVLYREALAMGLQEGDYIIRQRMVQKMEFLIEDTVAGTFDPVPAELESFYQAHAAEYAEPPVYTFTHVFFDQERRGRQSAYEAAARSLAELNRERVPFSGSLTRGDRPLFYQNYVERTRDFVVGHLGEGLAQALDQAEPSDSKWFGPLESPYGWHVILLTQRTEPRVPELAEIEDRVREDYRELALDQAKRRSIGEIMDEYDIIIQNLDREAD